MLAKKLLNGLRAEARSTVVVAIWAQALTPTPLPKGEGLKLKHHAVKLRLILRIFIVQGCGWAAVDLTANSHYVHAILTSTVHNCGDKPDRSEQLLWPRRNLNRIRRGHRPERF